jgi:hypothetical protein
MSNLNPQLKPSGAGPVERPVPPTWRSTRGWLEKSATLARSIEYVQRLPNQHTSEDLDIAHVCSICM